MTRNQSLASITAFLGDSYIIEIINYCNLYPLTNWYEWTDYQCNVLKIYKSKKAIIREKETKFIVTDIFRKADLNTLFNISKWIFVQNNLLFLLGHDNRLRLYNHLDYLSNKSPLSADLDLLKKVILNKNTDILEQSTLASNLPLTTKTIDDISNIDIELANQLRNIC